MYMGSLYDWLLEDNNPEIKYRTLTELFEKPIDDSEVQAVYDLIREHKDIKKIFSKQNEKGIWDNSEYGVHTSLRYLTALAEYGMHSDKHIDKAIDYAVGFLNDKENAIGTAGYDGCSNALVLRAMVMLGYHSRSDVELLIDKYVSSQLYDGGFMCRRLFDKKPDRKSCYKASVAGLLLYGACKQKGLNFENTSHLLDYFLRRDVFYKSDKITLVVDGKAGWRYIDNFFPVESMRIGLPQIMASLSILGAGNNTGTMNAWDLLMRKRNDNGRFILEGTLSKQPCSFGKVGQENKWVTFYALLAEKYKT